MMFEIVHEIGIEFLPAAVLWTFLACIRFHIICIVSVLAAAFANKPCLLFAFMIIPLRFTPMGSVERNLACCTFQFLLAFLTDQARAAPMFEIFEAHRGELQ